MFNIKLLSPFLSAPPKIITPPCFPSRYIHLGPQTRHLVAILSFSLSPIPPHPYSLTYPVISNSKTKIKISQNRLPPLLNFCHGLLTSLPAFYSCSILPSHCTGNSGSFGSTDRITSLPHSEALDNFSLQIV